MSQFLNQLKSVLKLLIWDTITPTCYLKCMNKNSLYYQFDDLPKKSEQSHTVYIIKSIMIVSIYISSSTLFLNATTSLPVFEKLECHFTSSCFWLQIEYERDSIGANPWWWWSNGIKLQDFGTKGFGERENQCFRERWEEEEGESDFGTWFPSFFFDLFNSLIYMCLFLFIFN